MKKTCAHLEPQHQLFVGARELAALLGCGHYTARKIADEAGAVVRIGNRVLFSVAKLREWADEQTEA